MKSSLKYSEWILIAVFLIFICSLVLIAKVNRSRAKELIAEQKSMEIIVAIDGAVKKPGQYLVDEGTQLQNVLKKAKPLPNADLKNLKLKELLRDSRHIHIEMLKEIIVHVGGAVVEPLDLILPVGSRISDLKSKIEVTPEADRTFFRRKRLLKEGDIIEVPKKKVEQN